MGIKLSTNFDVQAVSLPLDLRFVVADLVELNAMAMQYRYLGLKTYVESESKYYYLKDNLNDWVEFTSSSDENDYEYTVGAGGVQAFQVVFLTSANTIQPTDCNNVTMANIIVGIALSTGVEGEVIKVRKTGKIINPSWIGMFIAQDVVFVGNSGNITKSPTNTVGFIQKVGFFNNNDGELSLDFDDCVILE